MFLLMPLALKQNKTKRAIFLAFHKRNFTDNNAGKFPTPPPNLNYNKVTYFRSKRITL